MVVLISAVPALGAPGKAQYLWMPTPVVGCYLDLTPFQRNHLGVSKAPHREGDGTAAVGPRDFYGLFRGKHLLPPVGPLFWT